MTKYEVQHFTLCDGWINVWTDDKKPSYFNSYQEAEKEIREFVDDWNKHCEKDCEYEYEDYRVMEVKQKGKR